MVNVGENTKISKYTHGTYWMILAEMFTVQEKVSPGSSELNWNEKNQ